MERRLEAAELRIGNLVYRKRDSLVVRVDEVLTNRILYINPDLSNIKEIAADLGAFMGIPLKEEWLDKFGFKMMGDGQFDKGIGDFRVTLEYEIKWRGKIIMEAPEYVHQLQNLYYALTGEELKVNGI